MTEATTPSPPALPQVSTAKLLMLVPVIGGIVIASVSELDFTWACLAAAGGANVAAAFRGQENKKAMAGDMNAAIGGGANAYAIGTIWSTLLLIPTIFISGEYQKARKGVVGWGRGLGTVSEGDRPPRRSCGSRAGGGERERALASALGLTSQRHQLAGHVEAWDERCAAQTAEGWRGPSARMLRQPGATAACFFLS